MLKIQKRKEIFTNEEELERKRTKIQEDDESDYETDEEEKDLEAFLFGDTTKVIFTDQSTETELDEEKEEDNNGLLSFAISTKPTSSLDQQTDDDVEIYSALKNKVDKAAWNDEDDNDVTVDILNNKNLRKLKKKNTETSLKGGTFQERLKTQFEKILPAPAWADIDNAQSNFDGDSDSENEGNIFASAKQTTMKPTNISKGMLNITKLKNLNQSQPSTSTITSLEFHPHSRVAFTTSLNKKLSIFQADGKENRKLQSIFLAKFPIHTGHFTTDGDKIFMSSRRKFFYSYDLKSGKVIKIPGIRGVEEKSLEKFILSPDGCIIAFLGSSGYIHLVSIKTFHLISSIKMNGKVLSATFTPDSSQLITAGSDGEVYVWNVKSRTCQHRFIDDGALKTISLAVSDDSRYIAAGSSSGIVNVYDNQCLTVKRPKPIKVLSNLTTAIDRVSFNSTSELLCYSSPQVRNSLKLVHFPSLTTYSNWPIEKQTLGNVSCFGFSPLSGYIGVGNEEGKALLYRLNHYTDS